MQRITPFLWFDSEAEEAAYFYFSIFKNSKIVGVTYYGAVGAEVAHRPLGSVMTVIFELDGQEFIALNGGPVFKFSEAVSFVVQCKTQKEIDELWEKLSAGGEKGMCGWLKDKYGLSWQIVPVLLDKLLQDENHEKAESVTRAMLQMKKIDMRRLQEAYDTA